MIAIKKYRLQKHWKQVELAEKMQRCKVNRGNVGNWGTEA